MKILALNGQWQVSAADRELQVPATVPGCIHTDLLAAGKIEDPFFRDNEFVVQWVSEADWNYALSFDAPADFLQEEHVILRFEGLDTLAAVMLNGRLLGETANQFRTWEFDVKEILRASGNELSVAFRSPLPDQIKKDQERALRTPQHAGFEWPGRVYVRKAACNYGWDWGPALPTCGIWRPVKLLAYSTARLDDVLIRQDHSEANQVKLDITVAIEQQQVAGTLTTVVEIRRGDDLRAISKTEVVDGSGRFIISVDEPELWWPAGMGQQPLYEVRVRLQDRDGNDLDRNEFRIGLRTLELKREKDEWGESFYFSVNGVPFFAKGGNWIPADQFPTRVTQEHYQNLLQSCVAANMNMLRIWGGGIYENDIFYDLCDALGICLWQDFMFACAAYPVDQAFLDNVAIEAEENLKHLRHHPSIALWCGNNELEMCDFVNDSGDAGVMSWEEYDILFNRLLPDKVRQFAPDSAYWPSSPHSPYCRKEDANAPDQGDAHLWRVWHGREPFEWYRSCTHRFNSEFGFQSFPEPRTVAGYTAAEDRNITSYVMEHHQRSGVGNALIMHYMLDWFRMPVSFEMTLRLSQILQGMAIKYAVEHWRRSMPRGMGTLYWQINDCWPVTSWSSVDYHGRWKALHYMARRFFAPILLSAVEDVEAGTVAVHVTSDKAEPLTGVIRSQLISLDGNLIKSSVSGVTVAAHRNNELAVLDYARELRAGGKRQLLCNLELQIEGQVVSSDTVFFARPKHLLLPQADIVCRVQKHKNSCFKIDLTCDLPALWVWLEVQGCEAAYSDNYFHMMPHRLYTVEVQTDEDLTVEAFEQRLQKGSLVDAS